MGILNFTGSAGHNLTHPSGVAGGAATDLVLLAGSHADGKIGPYQPGTDGGFGTTGPYATATNAVAGDYILGAPGAPSTDHNSKVTRTGPATHYDPLWIVHVRASADGLTRYQLIQRIWGQFELQRVVGGVATHLEPYYNTFAEQFGLAVTGTGSTVTLTVYLDGVAQAPVLDTDPARIVAAGVPGPGYIGAASATPDKGGLYLLSWESDVYTAGGGNTAPTISIDQGAAASLEVGDTLQLTAAVADAEDDPDPAPSWTSDDEAVATVSSGGLVTAVAEGEAIVTATVTDADGASASDSITITVTTPAAADYVYTAVAVRRGRRSAVSNTCPVTLP